MKKSFFLIALLAVLGLGLVAGVGLIGFWLGQNQSQFGSYLSSPLLKSASLLVAGQVVSLDGLVLQLEDRGQKLTINLTADVVVSEIVISTGPEPPQSQEKKLADLKPGQEVSVNLLTNQDGQIEGRVVNIISQ
jgi:hypothetical protein